MTVGKSKQFFSGIIYMLAGRCALVKKNNIPLYFVHICIGHVTWCTRQASIQDWAGEACYATQPMRFSSRSHKTLTRYHNLSEHPLKEDRMKHHCLIILLAGDMGYISMVGHGQSQPKFHSFITSSIQPHVCLLHITVFENARLKQC